RRKRPQKGGEQCAVPSKMAAIASSEKCEPCSTHKSELFRASLSLLCTDRTVALREVIATQNNWISSYDMRPGSLFEGVAQRLCLLISSEGKVGNVTRSAGYRRWSAEERAALLDTTSFALLLESQTDGVIPWPKVALEAEQAILGKLVDGSIAEHLSKISSPIYVHRIVRYFIKALNKPPLFIDSMGSHGKSDDYKALGVDSEYLDLIVACLNSSIFYWYWRLTSDGFHCGYGDIYRFPFHGSSLNSHRDEISKLVKLLMASLEKNSVRKSITTKAGKIQYQEFSPKSAKSILDAIDEAVANAWGLSPALVDYLINYDIKYRMGLVGDAADD
ncbi:MAG: hypothetical protein WBP25_12490, partial [Giesbergeria sp.]